MSTIINATTTNGVVIQPDNSGSLVLQTNSGTTALTIDTSQRAAFVAGTAALPAITTTGDTNTGIWFPAADTIAFAEGGTEAMRIDSSGNVGIGITSPSSYGKFAVEGANQTNIITATVANTSFQTYVDGSVGEIRLKAVDTSGANNSKYMTFYTQPSGSAAVERMRITSTGNVGIGNDNPTGYNNAFTAITTSSYLPLFVGNTNTSATGPGIIVAKWLNSNATSNVLMQFLINGVATGSGQINANGASAAAFGSYSDARLKENIEPLPSQLDNILALKPSEFDYKDGSGHQIGFIAQEMQEVYPDVVSKGENDMLTITGWSKTEARLVKAIQEQQTIINDLKARVTALEAK